MSNDGIIRLNVTFEFDATRARFDKELFVILQVWDEIRQEYIRVTPSDSGIPGDLTRPGEGYRGSVIKVVPKLDSDK